MKISGLKHFVLASLLLAAVVLAPAASAQTKLAVKNGSNTEVEVWWNGTNPAANNITVKSGNERIPVRIPSIFTDAGKGSFFLAPNQAVIISRTSGGNFLNGTITFNSIPVCPCGGEGQPPCPQLDDFRLPKKLVNGVNQAEFALNAPSNFESIDISCVNGADSRIEMLAEGGSPKWQNNVTHQPVSRIVNRRVDVAAHKDENCAEVGVFPFNATDCVQTPSPPCGQPFCFHAVRDCQLDRQGSGGTVSVIIVGFDNL
ncbi:MAG TPA: hypothetical protein V6C69_20140 [Trichormus sp.]|jgi:hypothetical protein